MSHRLLPSLLALVVAAGLMATPTSAVAGTRASAVSVSATKTVVPVGSKVALAVTSPRGKFAAKDPVVLQKRTGERWTTVARASLAATGRTTLMVTPSLGTSSYRVVKSATRTYRQATSRTVAVTAQRRASSLTLRSTGSTIAAGASATLTAQASAGGFVAAEQVRFESRRPGGAWISVGSARLSRSGAATLQVSPAVGSTEYRVTKAQTATHVAATSPTATIHVDLRASSLVIGTTEQDLPAGSVATLVTSAPTGAFTSGDPVRFEEGGADGSWRELGTRTLDASGTASLPFTVTTESSTLRAVKPQTSLHAQAVSPVLTVSPRRAPSSVSTTAANLGALDDGVATLLVRVPADQHAPSDEVRVERLEEDGAWTTVASGTLSANGTADVDLRPKEGHWTHRVVKPRTARFEEAVSSEVSLVAGTPLDVRLESSEIEVDHGASVTLTARWSSPQGGRSSGWQRRDGARWVSVAQSPSRNQIVVTPEVGRQAYRHVVGPHGSLAGGISQAVQVVVHDPTPPVPVPGARRVEVDGPATGLVVSAENPSTASFDADAGQEIALSLRNTAPSHLRLAMAVVGPDGAPIALESGPQPHRRTFVAPRDGTYVLTVTGPPGQSGSTTLVVTEPSTTDIPLDGPPVRLTTDGPSGRELRTEFTARAGTFVNVATSKPFITEPRLVEVATGKVLHEQSYTLWAIPADGRYRFELESPHVTSWAGDLTFSTLVPEPITLNERPVEVTPDPRGVPRLYSFPLHVDSRGITTATTATSSVGAGVGRISTELLAPIARDGTLHRYMSHVGATSIFSAPIRWNGTYVAVVRHDLGATRPVELHVSTPQVTSTTLDAAPTTISSGDLAGRGMTVLFEGTAGQLIDYRLEEKDVPRPELGTYGPGVSLRHVESGEVYDMSGSAMPRLLRRSGTFALNVGPSRPGTGTYDLLIAEVVPTAVTPNSSHTVRVDRKGIKSTITVDLGEGNRGALVVTGTDLDGTGNFDVDILKGTGGSLSHVGDRTEVRQTTDEPLRIDVQAWLGSATGTVDLTVTTPRVHEVELDGSPVRLSAEGLAGRELRARFTARAGDVVSHDVRETSQWELDRYVFLAPAGERGHETLPVDVDRNGRRTWRIPEDGRYELGFFPPTTVGGSYGALAMEADLTLMRARRITTVADGGPVVVPIDRPGAAHVVTFPIVEGRNYTVVGRQATLSGDPEDGDPRVDVVVSPTQATADSFPVASVPGAENYFTFRSSWNWTATVVLSSPGRSTGGIEIEVRSAPL